MRQKKELQNLALLEHIQPWEPDFKNSRDYTVEENYPMPNLKLNTEEWANLNELSSIYENTEEELWTPERELKLDYSVFQDYQNKRKNRENENFHSVAVNMRKKADFYTRMDYDVKERNIRDYEIREMSKRKRVHFHNERKLSLKKAESLSKRLHSNRGSSVERWIKNSKSLRTLNLSNNSNTDSNLSKLSSTRKPLFYKNRKSIVVCNNPKEK